MAPANVKAYCMLRVTMRILLFVSWDGSDHGVDEGETVSVNPP